MQVVSAIEQNEAQQEGLTEQLERDTIHVRQAEGIMFAKEDGKYKGRKQIEIDTKLFIEQYMFWKYGKTSQKYICQKLGISHSTFKRRVREFEEQMQE